MVVIDSTPEFAEFINALRSPDNAIRDKVEFNNVNLT